MIGDIPPVMAAALAAALLALTLMALPWLLRGWVHWRMRSRVFTLEDQVPQADVALVLGAGLWPDGSLTPVLHDRVATAVDLYRRGTVRTLLMSGATGTSGYSEPAAMQRLALELGVPADAIVLDSAGQRTYDSAYRARAIYQVRRAVMVTQRFHLDRALYLATSAGIDAVGVVADRRRYRRLPHARSRLREVVATANAWLDIHLLHPHPNLDPPPEAKETHNPTPDT